LVAAGGSRRDAAERGCRQRSLGALPVGSRRAARRWGRRVCGLRRQLRAFAASPADEGAESGAGSGVRLGAYAAPR